jgi:hypothetical protein
VRTPSPVPPPAPPFDPRVTLRRGDRADSRLRGRIEAAAFLDVTPMQTSAGVAAVRRAPVGDAEMTTQLLHGELFEVLEEENGWAFGACAHDGYVGWVDLEALSAPVLAPTHRVTALRAYVFSEPNLKSAPVFLVSMGARIVEEDRQGRFVRAARAGWVFEGHLAPIDEVTTDWVAAAERYRFTPYLWGGREGLGCDCSGLVQIALGAGGIAAPRDSDQQEAALGRPLTITPDLSGLDRGDLVFWRGHVGIMTSATDLLHANGWFMETTLEPLAVAAARIAQTPSGEIRAIQRLLPPANSP